MPSSLKYIHIKSKANKIRIKSQYRNKFLGMIEEAISGLVTFHFQEKGKVNSDPKYQQQHKVVTKCIDLLKTELEKNGIPIPN